MLAFWAAKYLISIKENYALAAYKLLSHFEGKSINNCDFFFKGAAISVTRPRHEHILDTPLFVVQSSAVCVPHLLVLCSQMFYGVLNGNGCCSE
jgi:hypothetical protein